ncbi:MAG: helix-turn-helix domain-containing protein [Candidatus Harrisonbacteria bacterium]|nr:helix-turn-helix domain-containing protein [Candidatus Harrisonbacteria bacterium]
MAKFKEKAAALRLRRKGNSIKDIAVRLQVSKGSVSSWCRDILLTDKQNQTLHTKMVKMGHRGRLLGAMKQKMERLKHIERLKESGKQNVGRLSKRDVMLLGIGLYLGEGRKSGNRAEICNSNYEIILLAVKWFKSLGMKHKDLRGGITINRKMQKYETKIRKEWSQLTKIAEQNISKTVFIKSKQEKTYPGEEIIAEYLP